jgi:crotonobetainyl-CoA:carnitine CoA-transferase CaiB-like acyl-CoA transferase
MQAPLANIRVVELATFVAAPAAGALLADLGADVIKVEIPQGELYRHAIPRREGIKHDFPEAPHFQFDNRGKRSLTLDLNEPAALAALLRVIAGADVFLTNMLPQRLRRYGLDPDTLRARLPQLIVAALTGYGLRGEESEKPAFDYSAYWARSGLMDQMREPDAPPAFQRPAVGDHAASLALVTGILAALRTRDAGGGGQLIDVSLLHIGYYVLGSDVSLALATGQAPPRHDRRGPRNPLWNHYAVKDGRWIFLVMLDSQRYWPELCAVLERPDLVADPRFSGPVERYRNAAALTGLLADIFAARTLAEWETVLAAAKLIWAPVRTLTEAVADPQARAAGVFSTVRHPTAGTFETVAPPLHLSAFSMRGDRPAPALGADAAAVLREAGLSDEEIRAALPTPKQ